MLNSEKNKKKDETTIDALFSWCHIKESTKSVIWDSYVPRVQVLSPIGVVFA